ncbi:hypothetical protein [Ferruginibacter sp.]
MSWDLFVFSSAQKIAAVETIDESQFIPIDFDSLLEAHFSNMIHYEDHKVIENANYRIEYTPDRKLSAYKVLSIFGEEGLFELAAISKKHGWQIYDTGSGEMIDLEHPEKNGYANFKAYRDQVLGQQKG